MLVPFVASSLLLMYSILEKEEKRTAIQKSVTTAKWMTLIGFGIILVSLVVFNYVIQIR